MDTTVFEAMQRGFLCGYMVGNCDAAWRREQAIKPLSDDEAWDQAFPCFDGIVAEIASDDTTFATGET